MLQQVDVLPFSYIRENQMLRIYIKLLHMLLLRIYNDTMSKSHEQRVITKEHLATHTH